MSAKLGRNIIFEWNNSEVKGVREKGINQNGEPVDLTSDDDNGWRTLHDEAGQNQLDISINGVSKDNTLRTDWFEGTRTRLAEFTFPDGGVISGQFFLASYNETGSYNGATTFEATLQSTGAVTYTNYS